MTLESSQMHENPQRWLRQWLREWQAEQLLLAAPPPPPDADSATSAPPATLAEPAPRRSSWARSAATPHPCALQCGDIILLPPDSAPTSQRPCYVALWSESGERWLCLPFGRFSIPALPAEWHSGRLGMPLRVLCLWNNGMLASTRLRRGWYVGRLTAHERAAIAALHPWRNDHAPPAGYAVACGAPLLDPLDPRHDYIEEERTLWLEAEISTTQFYRPGPDRELPIAAEPPPSDA